MTKMKADSLKLKLTLVKEFMTYSLDGKVNLLCVCR